MTQAGHWTLRDELRFIDRKYHDSRRGGERWLDNYIETIPMRFFGYGGGAMHYDHKEHIYSFCTSLKAGVLTSFSQYATALVKGGNGDGT